MYNFNYHYFGITNYNMRLTSLGLSLNKAN